MSRLVWPAVTWLVLGLVALAGTACVLVKGPAYRVWAVVGVAGLLWLGAAVVLNAWSRHMKAVALASVVVVLGYFLIVMILRYFVMGVAF